MPRMENKTVPESNGPVPQQEELVSGQPTLVDVYQKIDGVWDRRIDTTTRHLEQNLTSLKQDAWQPRLAMVADGHVNTKIRKRTDDAAIAVQAIHGDSCSADRVNPDPMRYISSVMTSPDLRHPLVQGRMLSLTTALRRPNLVSHHWRCPHQQPLVVYFSPAKPLRQHRSPSSSHLFGSTQPRRRIQRRHIDLSPSA